MSLADLRKEYGIGALERDDLAPDPLTQFNQWFGQAAATQSGGRWRKIGIALYKLWQAMLGRGPADANAMALATADKEGRPSVRMVLLKGVDERGFIFFTNYESRKGRELAENPIAALVFHWVDLERQICVAGQVSKVSRAESEAYFKSRPRGARLSACVSNQSEIITDRRVLEQRLKESERKFPGEDIPRPDYWGGYVLSPTRIEFWQGRPNRLHDRFRYTKQADGNWLIERLAP